MKAYATLRAMFLGTGCHGIYMVARMRGSVLFKPTNTRHAVTMFMLSQQRAQALAAPA